MSRREFVARSIADPIRNDLREKIVILTGPRQVGKTSVGRHLLQSDVVYLSFDNEEDRRQIRAKQWRRDADLVVFDELHKWKNWKRWLKGIYDTEGIPPSLLVTGSARADLFKKMGDSLAGRHHAYRLHPFSVAEVGAAQPADTLHDIMRLGGFPEPLLSGSERTAKRWRRSHLDRILREDLLDLTAMRDIPSIELLVDLLAERVGSPVSYSSLARSLEVSPHTIKSWLRVLEGLYIVFVVRPFATRSSKSLLKQPKVYFFDTGRVTAGESARLENTVACHLLKRNHFLEDTQGDKLQLHYLRDKEKREVDFLTVRDRKPELLIEVKQGDDRVSPHLRYHEQRLRPTAAVQVVLDLHQDFDTAEGIRVKDCATWLAGLET